MGRGEGKGEGDGEGGEGWVEEAREEWHRLAGLLLAVWTRKQNVVGNPALSHLLLCLDFNGHLSRGAIHAGLRGMAGG